MDDILVKLTVLSNYFKTNRGAGHTTAMLNGALNINCVVVVQNHQQLDQQLHPFHTVVPIHDLSKLKGIRKPLVIDNFPLNTILSEAAHEIVKLRKEIIKLKTKARSTE